MRTIIWLAFEPSAVSAQRLRQLDACASLLQSDIVIVTKQAIVPTLNGGHGRVLVCDEIWDALPNPADFVVKLLALLPACDIIAILSPHSQQYLRILSQIAAFRHMLFIPGMCTRGFPACTRLICAGRIIETIQTPDVPFAATLALDEPAPVHSIWTISSDNKGEIGDLKSCIASLVSFEPFTSDGIQLDGARIVFAGGRGLGSKESFEKLGVCAARYGAALAASRLAVDLGWCRNDLQVGQTGQTIAPDIYVAFGISGAIQHLAGIRNAKKIIAINTDKDAPIMRYADYAVIADANEVVQVMMG